MSPVRERKAVNWQRCSFRNGLANTKQLVPTNNEKVISTGNRSVFPAILQLSGWRTRQVLEGSWDLLTHSVR